MRAVNKGSVPINGGVPKTVSDYKDWRQDLIDRIGAYCCYCNMPLPDSPQVEHVKPKNPAPGQPAGAMVDWDNMLLGCGSCNRIKSNKPTSTSNHYLPDFHNTHMVFEYVVQSHPQKPDKIACIPIASTATNVNTTKAQTTIDLCGLDRIVVNNRATDLRWMYRYRAFVWANLWKQSWDKWDKARASEFTDLLITQVKASGFFSIWLNVFADSPLVIKEIVSQIPGNNMQCYDAADFHLIPLNLP
jgi:hypothetical protein